ncbi:MAG: dTMP kinase [Candidatus Promineifilaceae bacterium]
MFITFEGSDGGGKSTQITLLSFYLRQEGYKVIATREPGGTTIGEQVRNTLHDVANKSMTATAEALLYSASRAQLVEEIIRPALASQHIVLCDRYADSTLAYQGYGRGLDLNDLTRLNRLATGGLKPDLTFLFDIEIEAGLSRRSVGGVEMNRMDMQAVEFYRRVMDGYRELAHANPGRWVSIDAARPVEAIQNDLRRHIKQRLKNLALP